MNGYNLFRLALLPLSMTTMVAGGVEAAGFLEELDGSGAVYSRDTMNQSKAESSFSSPGVEVVAETEMANLRGGFEINGLDLSFGARLQSMIDEVLYQTVVEFTARGPNVISRSLVDPVGKAIEINPGVGTNVMDVTPSGVSLPGLREFTGIALNDNKGFTTVLHNVTNRSMVGAVVSDASQREIGNHMNIDISINNMEALRSLGAQSRIINSLAR